MASNQTSKIITCGHCSNVSHMKSVGHIFVDETPQGNEFGPQPNQGTYYDVFDCPACHRENIVKYFWHDFMESEEDLSYELLYPMDNDIPLGLPKEIKKSFVAAQKIKLLDANSYALLIRRVLELVCFDREAEGRDLAKKLKFLSDKGEIPQKLVRIAKGLRLLGNIGAHERYGSLGEKEVPILRDMIKSILEYVYTAPFLAELAEKKLEELSKYK